MVSNMMLLAAAKPWTYWLAPTLLIAQLLLLGALAVRLYRKILVPSFAWMYDEEPERHAEMLRARTVALETPVETRTPPAATLKAA
jgi:hypothetical protein